MPTPWKHRKPGAECLTRVSGAFWDCLLWGSEEEADMNFFRILGQGWWGQQPLRTAYCLHGTFCLVLKDHCGKSISCCPSWDWSPFPVYLEFAGPRRLPRRKWSLCSEVDECAAANAKSEQLQPGPGEAQKPGGGAEWPLTPRKPCRVLSHTSLLGLCAEWHWASGLPERVPAPC